ncbi:MAG: hypothetical protein ABGW50_01615 [Thermococcus sp.]
MHSKQMFFAIADKRYYSTSIPFIAHIQSSILSKHGVRAGILVRMGKFTKELARMCEEHGIYLFVDNGAFDILTKDILDKPIRNISKLRLWALKVADFIAKQHTDVDGVALPDVPVHGKEFVPRKERMDRIYTTAELHRLAVEHITKRDPEALSKAVAVLQGYEPGEYVASLTLHQRNLPDEIASFYGENDVFGGVLAVGSVCVRKPSNAPSGRRSASGKGTNTLDQLMSFFMTSPVLKPYRFHFFGLHMTAFRKYWRYPRFASADTGGHGLDFRLKWRTILKCSEPNAECYNRALLLQVKRAGFITREEYWNLVHVDQITLVHKR